MLEYITTGIGYLCLIGVFGVVSNYVYIMIFSVCKLVYKGLLRIYLCIKSYIESLWIKYFTNWEEVLMHIDLEGLVMHRTHKIFCNPLGIILKDGNNHNVYTPTPYVLDKVYYNFTFIPVEVSVEDDPIIKDKMDFYISLFLNKKAPKLPDIVVGGVFEVVKKFIKEKEVNINEDTFNFIVTELSDYFLDRYSYRKTPRYWRPSNTPEYKTDLILTIGSIMVSTIISVVLFLLS